MAASWLRVIVEISSPMPTVQNTYNRDAISRNAMLPRTGTANQSMPTPNTRSISMNAISPYGISLPRMNSDGRNGDTKICWTEPVSFSRTIPNAVRSGGNDISSTPYSPGTK